MRVFTRNLADITHRVPEVVDVVRRLPVHDVILDGETLSLDEDGAPRPFQETMSRFGADAARETVLHPWFFDVLHVDGRDLHRRAAARCGSPSSSASPARIASRERSPPIRRSPSASRARPSPPGTRASSSRRSTRRTRPGARGSSWIKVKPVHTYDLVVLACEWGSGRRTGWLSNLHLGALDPTGEFGEPGGFVMVGKTFKGLTDELLRWQTEYFPQIEVRAHRRHRLGRTDDGRRDRDRRRAALEPLSRAASPCGSRASSGTATTSRPADADTIQTLRALAAGVARAPVARHGFPPIGCISDATGVT